MVEKQARSSRPVISRDIAEQERDARQGEPSMYTCPDCGGVLWQVDDEDAEFECHTAHHWSGENLAVAKSRAVEQALSEAVRVLREKATLLRQLAVRGDPLDPTIGALIEQAEQDDEHARLIKRNLLGREAHAYPSSDTSDHVMSRLTREMRRAPDD